MLEDRGSGVYCRMICHEGWAAGNVAYNNAVGKGNPARTVLDPKVCDVGGDVLRGYSREIGYASSDRAAGPKEVIVESDCGVLVRDKR